METLLSVLVGVGLSAACGFRVFIPLLAISIASFSGHLTLASGFRWMGTYAALLAFAIATVLEIAGYYIPWVDHLLDLAASPAAVIAGIVAMASSVAGPSPFLRWSLAIIAGGGIAATVQMLTGLTRLTSSSTTAGLGNPFVSTAEAAGATVFSAMALIIPIVCAIILTIFLVLAYWPGHAMLRRIRSKVVSPRQLERR
jgi:hypothetical protein